MINCPICKGTGKLEEYPVHKSKRPPETNEVAKILQAEGYSIRQIMRILNYKSPRSVQILLDKK